MQMPDLWVLGFGFWADFFPNWEKSYAHENPLPWEWPQPPPPEALDSVPDAENMDMSFSGPDSPHLGHLSPDPSSLLLARVSNW
jgi:hypothetical protein